MRDLGYTERRRILNLESLSMRRDKRDLVEVFKMMKGFTPLVFSDFFVRADLSRTRGHSAKLGYKDARTWRGNRRKFYFSNRVIETWNSLPENVVIAPSVSAFKDRLNSSPLRGFYPWSREGSNR